jgi:hypothetical protein
MGMDLIALSENAAIGGYHVNFTGWGQLGDLLVELGCDVSSMTSGNDGDVVDATTATAWAEALTLGLTRGLIYQLKYPDPTFSDGWRDEFHVEGTKTPVLLSTHMYVEMLVNATMGASAFENNSDLDAPPERVNITEGGDTYAWLSEVAEFFANSGGFEQW